MQNKTLKEKEAKLLKEIKALHSLEKELKEMNEMKLQTNIAYILNQRLFEDWGDFTAFMEIQLEKHRENESDSIVEVTFKLKKNKSAKKEL